MWVPKSLSPLLWATVTNAEKASHINERGIWAMFLSVVICLPFISVNWKTNLAGSFGKPLALSLVFKEGIIFFFCCFDAVGTYCWGWLSEDPWIVHFLILWQAKPFLEISQNGFPNKNVSVLLMLNKALKSLVFSLSAPNYLEKWEDPPPPKSSKYSQNEIYSSNTCLND